MSADSKHSEKAGNDNPAFVDEEKIAIEIENGEGRKEEEEKDEWAVDWEEEIETVKWSELSTSEKIKEVCLNTAKIIIALACLYIFICSISILGDAFQVLAGKTAGEIFSNESFLSNPITGLIIGILVTVLVQSSSTSTSIIITMVAANILQVQQAIPIIMGANIGTSVTNTIVALSQSIDKKQFKKAFAGGTVHDIFNLLCVLVLLPIEIISGYLYLLTELVIESFRITQGSEAPDFLKVITDPVTEHIIQVNKSVIELAANTSSGLEDDASMINVCCGPSENASLACAPCTSADFLFADTGLSDPVVGAILLVVSLVVLSSCLIGLVKVLGSMLKGTVAKMIKKIINLDFNYPFGWVVGYIAMLAGAGLTFIVQSSSVFTSTITPLVGLGVIGLDRMYPLTLGSNIGTTTTSILAALASDPDRLEAALQIALVHLFFNISGILIWYPIPFMRIPIPGAKFLGETAAEYRWFAVLYLVFVFFLIPALLLGLSFVSEWLAVGVVAFAVLISLIIALVTTLQRRRPKWLPARLRTWKFLPVWMRSLKPYDSFFTRVFGCCKCCHSKDEDGDDVVEMSCDDVTPSTSSSTSTTSNNTINQRRISSLSVHIQNSTKL